MSDISIPVSMLKSTKSLQKIKLSLLSMLMDDKKKSCIVTLKNEECYLKLI